MTVCGGAIGTAQAAATFVMGGVAGSTLAPNSGAWSWDGEYLAGYRGALGNRVFFGPSGTVPRSIATITLTSISAETLRGLNLFISPKWFNSDSAPYNQLVVNFFRAGGNLFLLDDMSDKSGIAALLGVPTHDSSDGSVSNGGAPLFNGPFGFPTNVTQAREHGYLMAPEIYAHHGFVCAMNPSNQITAACFNAGAYAPGAGAMVITTDVDMITTLGAGGTAAYTTPPSSNAIFALNATAFLLTNPQATGRTAGRTMSALILFGLTALGIGLAIAMVVRRRARVSYDPLVISTFNVPPAEARANASAAWRNG
jgi:hypothetical protein